jgi:membrane protein DedA with SNARE-associated domain
VKELVHLLAQYGVPLLFLNVFLEQIGLPLPAVPALIVAGAMSADGKLQVSALMPAAVLASLLADVIWFALGRRLGNRVLRLLCRISLSPDSCVRTTESFFERWGMASLLFAKFIPGFSTVAPPMAGSSRRSSTAAFLFYDTLGAAIWAGAAIGAGRLFHRQIDRLLGFLSNLGFGALILVAFLLGLWILLKWRERRRFFHQLRMARITPDELSQLMKMDQVVVIDARSSHARKLDPRRIPGAIPMTVGEVDAHLSEIDRGREIIVYCT